MTMMMPQQSLSSKFTYTGGGEYPKAEFSNKAEFNNFKVMLDRRGARFDTHVKKRTKTRPAVFTVILRSPLAELS